MSDVFDIYTRGIGRGWLSVTAGDQCLCQKITKGGDHKSLCALRYKYNRHCAHLETLPTLSALCLCVTKQGARQGWAFRALLEP
jgi:hypothetical protein